MEIANEPITYKTIAYIVLILFITATILYFLLKYFNKTRRNRSLKIVSAKDVLKFSPIESVFSIVLKYNNLKENVGGLITSKDIEYILIEKRMVQVTFDFSSIIENRDTKKRVLRLSKLPVPIIEIHKEPLEFRDYTTKNKTKWIEFKKKNIDTDVILKTRREAVNMIMETAEKSGLKDIAIKRLNTQIEMLQKALAQLDWNLQIENE